LRYDFGICWKCGTGHIIKQWGGIQPQFYCDNCGIVTVHPGNMYVPKSTIMEAIDYTFNVIGSDKLMIEPLMETVGKVLGVKPSIHIGTLKENGYEINGDYIIRRK
jgi:hypothetical protein